MLDTVAQRCFNVEELRIKPPTFRMVDLPLYLLSLLVQKHALHTNTSLGFLMERSHRDAFTEPSAHTLRTFQWQTDDSVE